MLLSWQGPTPSQCSFQQEVKAGGWGTLDRETQALHEEKAHTLLGGSLCWGLTLC